MTHYMSRTFWLNALDRAIRTFAQALLAFVGADGLGIVEAPWTAGLSVAAMAALLSVLTSIATPDTVETGKPVVAYRGKHAHDDNADPTGALTD